MLFSAPPVNYSSRPAALARYALGAQCAAARAWRDPRGGSWVWRSRGDRSAGGGHGNHIRGVIRVSAVPDPPLSVAIRW